MRLEIAELKSFQAVIEENGFNRAAERLHVSQSAISQAIANLESKLNTSLLTRGKQINLTPAGRRLLEYANEVLREEQQVLEDINLLKQGDTQTLNLAINSTINRYYAPHLLAKFSGSQRDTRIKVTELPSRNLIYAILANRAEVAMGPFQRNMSAFQTIPLYEETRFLVISPRHPHCQDIIKGNKNVMKQSPLITSFLDKSEKHPSIQRLRDHFRLVWEVSSLSLRIHLVNQGLGVAFIDSKSLQENPVCSDFIVLEGLSFGKIERQVGIYYKSGRMLNSSTNQFIELCREFWWK